MKKLILALALIFLPCTALAWEGFDWTTGNYVEIEKGNLVRVGEIIEVFNYSDGQYKQMEVMSIFRYGKSVELEVYDFQKGEIHIFEMTDR